MIRFLTQSVRKMTVRAKHSAGFAIQAALEFFQ